MLRALLNGGDANAPLRGTGQLLSVLIDSINEKCFDVFGDTVVVFETDEPSVPEDYAEELRGILS